MGRKKKGIPIHGWLVIDKPLEMSSNAVVGKARWLTKAQKVGHGGTLDPLASGVLPLAFGEATKTVSFVMDGAKTYRFDVTWGENRTTDDAEGEVEGTSDKRPSLEAIKACLPDFIGEIQQVPPKYSALKIDGQRAYKLAREGQDIEMQARRVKIDDLRLIDAGDSTVATFEVDCHKGTYVRSLARDLGAKLGCLGYVSALRRTKVGKFSENASISLDLLEEIMHKDALSTHLLALETVLDDIPALALDADETRKIRNGMALSVAAVGNRLLSPADLMLLKSEDQAVALARIEDGAIRPFRVFNL